MNTKFYSSKNMINVNILAALHYLDGNNKMASIFQEIVCIQGDDSRLVRLSNISKDDIHHTLKKTGHCFNK